jgi:uncharacterized protein
MADSYLIDGYNLIHALGMIQKHMAPGGLAAARTRLLELLAAGFGADASSCTVVFDAKQAPRGVSRSQDYRGLAIRFAPKQQSADDLIETLIAEAADPKALVVVSNDARLQHAAKRRGARAWSHEAILDLLEKRQAPAPTEITPTKEKTDHVSPEEMKHWLKEFGALEKDPKLKEFFDLDRFD